MQAITIPSRFRGPPTSANGGWTCGTLARFIDGPARVTLRKPVPLDVEMHIARGPEGVRMVSGETLIAEAEAVDPPEFQLPPAVSWERAERATASYPWRDNHPYAHCFVCGPARTDDGLRLFPGPVESDAGAAHAVRVAATPWIVPGDLCEPGVDNVARARTELLWAALDCPSWFGFRAFDDHHGFVLLGRLTAQVIEHPQASERCVVGGWLQRRDGRKILCGSAIWRADGSLLAAADAVWIELRDK